jgi:hypothetical protein
MSDDNEQTENRADGAGLTKQKKPRSEAQIAAFEKARAVQAAKRDEKASAASGRAPDPDKERKKIILQAVKEKLNGEPKSKVVEPETDEESEEEAPPPPPKKKSSKKVVAPPPVVKAKKEPKVIYQEESSESEEEVIVVKKRKPKKKTIIYEESESEEEPPKKTTPHSRDTKSQMNKSMFKVTPGKAEAPKALYYFAD